MSAAVAQPNLTAGTGITARGVEQDFLEREYFSPEQLGQFLGVTQRTIFRWDSLRCGPPRTKLGKRTLYKKSSVIAWLSAKEQHQARASRLRSR